MFILFTLSFFLVFIYFLLFFIYINLNQPDSFSFLFTFLDMFYEQYGIFFISSLVIPLCVIFSLYCRFLKKNKRKNRWRIKSADKLLNKLKQENVSFPSFMNYMRKIDPFVFEELLLTSFKLNGFKIIRNKRYTGDGGLDGIVYIKGEKYLIQAKRYSSYINKKHVSDFKILCLENKAKGFFIHTGKTGKETKMLFDDNISYISGERLYKFIIFNDISFIK